MLEAFTLQRRIALPGISMNQAARSYRALERGDQTGRLSIGNLPHADSSDALSIFLNGGYDQPLVQIQSAWQILFRAADRVFVHFYAAGKKIASRPTMARRNRCNIVQAASFRLRPRTRCKPRALAPFFCVVIHHMA